MNDASIEEIQTKIAFLERANVDLSDVVFRQQQEIHLLALRLKELSERLDGVAADEPPRAAGEERPPHY